MADSTACPTRDDLQQMVLGRLPDADADAIQMHLDRCRMCLNALQECVASDDFLDAVRTSRPDGCEPTKTMYLPVGWMRDALSTWIRSHDSTQPDQNGGPLSIADVKSLLGPPQAGDVIGRIGDFGVLRILGVGGMAVVFEAEDTRLKRRVALKLMRPAIAATPGAADRFLREAQSAAALNHPNVVTIHQVGMCGETPFMALELLRGETLEDYLTRNGRLNVDELVRIGLEIATGLAAAHAQDLLHRDIKPANIWLEDADLTSRKPVAQNGNQHSSSATTPITSAPATTGGRSAGKVKILDFGLAKTWTNQSGISYPGLLIGTPAYMAPEQLAGNAVDPRMDLFSLGCLLYRMAGGKPPFGGDDLLSVLRALALEEPVPIQDVNPQVPKELSDLITELLSKTPDKRPPSADAVVERLRAIEEQLPAPRIAAKPAAGGLSTRFRQIRGQRSPRTIGALVGVLVLLALVSLLFAPHVIRRATNKGPVVIKADDPHVEATVSGAITKDQHPPAPVPPDLDRAAAMWVLSQGGTLAVRRSHGATPVTIARAEDLPPRDIELTAVHLQKREVTDAELKHFRGLTDLVELDLGRTQVTDAGLAALTDLKQLEALTLWDTRVTDTGLAALRSLRSLRFLNLNVLPVTDAGLAAIGTLKTLQQLLLIQTRVTDAGLTHLKNLTHLETLYIGETHVSDSGLAELRGLKNLQVLGLNGTRVTNAGLAHLAKMRRLDSLFLSGTPISDAGLAHLRSLPRLHKLDLGSTPVTDAGLAELQGLKNLRVLNLKGAAQIGDGAVPMLMKLRKLAELDVTDTRLSAKGIAALTTARPTGLRVVWSNPNMAAAKAVLAAGGTVGIHLPGSTAERSINVRDELPSEPFQITTVKLAGARPPHVAVLAALANPAVDGLVSLDLSGAAINDAVWQHLKRLTRLRCLVLAGTFLREPELQQLGDLANLDELDLSGTETTDAGLAHLRGLSKLTSLSLDRTQVTDAGLSHVAAIATLQVLTLRRTAVTDAGLKHLARLTGLTSLVLEKTRISDAGLAHLRGLKELTNLSLLGTSVTDAGLEHIRGLTKLEQLWLGYGTPVTDAGLVHLIALKRLHLLMLSRTAVSDAGLVRLEGLTELQWLSLSGTHVTDAGLAHLRGLTKLRHLNLSELPLTDAALVHVEVLKNLQEMDLGQTRVTNANLAGAGLNKLRWLSLSNCHLSDAGAKHLAQLTHLEHLDLSNTPVTAAHLAALKTSLPQCRIVTTAASQQLASP